METAMSTKTRRITTALALLLALLAGTAANALPRDGRLNPVSQEPAGLFAPLWDWLARLVASGGLTAVWGEEGPIMNPDGKPADAGPIMDPDGYSADAGGEMDPNGAPHGSLLPTDEGPMMDPNG
jgi:hypothetical protein